MENQTALTWWLVILTLLVAVQTVAITIVAVRSLRLFKRTETTLDGVDRAVGPLTASANSANDLLSGLQTVRQTAHLAKQAVIYRAWPVLGVIAAGRAMAKQFSARRRRSPDTRQDEAARARFTDEGGPIHDAR